VHNFIYFDDFERTEFSDEIHAVIGRSLIVATRFDNLCKSLARLIDFKICSVVSNLITEGEFHEIISKIFEKNKNLNRVIQKFPVDKQAKDMLHDAREARNTIAHSLTIGFEGTFDHKSKDEIDEMIGEIKELVRRVIKGDVIISTYISNMNKESILNNCFENSYEDQVIGWVTERYET